MATLTPELFCRCLDEIAAGRTTPDECLAANPEVAHELASLLAVVQSIRPRAAEIDPAFRLRARLALMDVIHGEQDAAGTAPLARLRRLLGAGLLTARTAAVKVALSAFLVATTAGVTVAAAQTALPGDTLYPVKLGAEELGVALTVGEDQKARVHLELAGRRAAEAEEARALGRPGAAAEATAAHASELAAAERHLARAAPGGGAADQAPRFVPPAAGPEPLGVTRIGAPDAAPPVPTVAPTPVEPDSAPPTATVAPTLAGPAAPVTQPADLVADPRDRQAAPAATPKTPDVSDEDEHDRHRDRLERRVEAPQRSGPPTEDPDRSPGPRDDRPAPVRPPVPAGRAAQPEPPAPPPPPPPPPPAASAPPAAKPENPGRGGVGPAARPEPPAPQPPPPAAAAPPAQPPAPQPPPPAAAAPPAPKGGGGSAAPSGGKGKP